MESIENIVEQERRKGWHITLRSTQDGWICEMSCGVDILPANIPRPNVRGSSAMVALVLAIRERDQKYGKQAVKQADTTAA